MGNPSQVTTHNLQQTHQKEEEGGVEISTKSDAENRTQSQSFKQQQQHCSPAAVLAPLSCSRRSSSLS